MYIPADGESCGGAKDIHLCAAVDTVPCRCGVGHCCGHIKCLCLEYAAVGREPYNRVVGGNLNLPIVGTAVIFEVCVFGDTLYVRGLAISAV